MANDNDEEFWKSYFSQTEIDGKKVHLVLSEGEYSDEDDETFTLFISENLFTSDKKSTMSSHFKTLQSGKEYCLKQYAIPVDKWNLLEDETLSCSVDFTYKVPYDPTAVTAPYIEAPENAKVIIRCGEMKTNDTEFKKTIDICGNEEGLKYLAKTILLTIESQKYDKNSHSHLSDDEVFELYDTEVTLRSPQYYDAIKEGPIDQHRWDG